MPLRDREGRVIGVIGTFEDITSQKHAEEALRESESRFRRLTESNIIGILVGDDRHHILEANAAFLEMLGYTQEELRAGKLCWDQITPADHQHVNERIDQQLKTSGVSAPVEIEFVRKDCSRLPAMLGLVALDAPTTRAIGFVLDLTERKQAEQQARLLTTALESAANGIMIANREGRIVWVNPAFTRLSGYSAAEVIGQNPRVWKSGAHDAAFYRKLWNTVLSGEVWQGEIINRRKDGSLYTEGMTVTPVRDATGMVSHFITIKQDITDRKRGEAALRESEQRYRELFENASDLVYTLDLDFRLTSLNRMAERTIGYSREETIGKNVWQLLDAKPGEQIAHAVERLLAGDSNFKINMEITTKDGRRVMLEVNPSLIYEAGQPVGFQAIGRDITGRDVAEMELRHAQKLESVGRLASGIAHEINTPIQFVGDNTRFLQDSFASLETLLSKYQELRDAAAGSNLRPELLPEVRRLEEETDCAFLLEEIPKALTQTLEGVDRVATIVRAMKEFAHPESKEMAAADLNKALLSTLTVARNELKYVADVETDFGALPLVVCNVGDLNQVFLNLLVNAAHAIAEVVKGTGTKGKIRVSTAAQDGAVLIAISDTGSGIPEAIRSRIYDPFFTTKEVGRGTGQGLAIARSVVVDRHKGNITFESEMGKGTTFYIRLPVNPEGCSQETKVP
jgi:PAS domain S-box-containing protein